MGSHLTDKLMMDGHEVTVVDNFFTGRKRNVEHWIGHENFELINHDVVEPLYIEAVWGNLVNMSFLLNRSLQENGDLRIESKIEEIVEPLREKIRDLEKSFTQKYPPVKFLSEKDRKRILLFGATWLT